MKYVLLNGEALDLSRNPRQDIEFLLDLMRRAMGEELHAAIRAFGIRPVRTSYRSPWQKDYASYCTSWGGSAGSPANGLRCESLRPCILAGGWSPGCS